MKKIALFLGMCAAGMLALYFGGANFRAAQASVSWPSVPGKIISSEAHAGEGCIVFSYNVAGEKRTSTTVLFGEENTQTGGRSPSCHDDVVRRYPLGKDVQVRYDPRNPAYAILEPGVNPGIVIVPAIGLVFTLLGGWLLWKEIAARFRVRRGALAPLSGPIDGVTAGAPQLITPSEVVAIHGARFAAQTVSDNTTLLDGVTQVSARELLLAELKAAILAHEQAGTIRLEISGTGEKRQLHIVPTGTGAMWPSPSTESRLEFPAREEATVAVRRWLAEPSHAGWQRASEKMHIHLVLRGLAVISQRGRQRTYILTDRHARAEADRSLPAVASLLEGCAAERPEVASLLASAIENAVDTAASQMSQASSVYVATDPWYDEAESAVKSTPGLKLLGDVGTPGWQVAIVAAILWSLAGATAYYSGTADRIALGVGAVLTALLFGAAVRWGQDLARQAAGWWPLARPTIKAVMESERWKAAAILSPIGALAAELVYSNRNDPRAIAGGAAAVVVGGMWLLRKKSGQAITEHVTGASKSPVTAFALAAKAGADGGVTIESIPVPAPTLPFDIEIVRPPDLPPVSPNSRMRLQAIRERGPRLRQLYRRSAFLIICGSMAVALAAWWILDPQLASGNFPWITFILFIASLIFMSGARSENAIVRPVFLMARYAVRYLRGGASKERLRWENEITPIRPTGVPMLAFAWALFTAIRGFTYLSAPTQAKWIPVMLSAAVVLWYVVRLRRGRKSLETLYPVYPALNLVALRVFSSPSRDRFVELLDLWHWFGPLYRLDGPDTAGGKSSDVLAYVTGRLDQAITEDKAELDVAVKNFSQTRDSQLRFAFNSLQCNDRIWKEALQTMLDRAHVVVMDLSGLTERNRGCAYEVGKLVTEVPPERFLLLIDDDTDIDCLRGLLSEAVAREKAGAGRRKLRLFHLGTQPRRKENESVYEWQRRTATPIDADSLIGILCDAACANRPAPIPITVPWTRPGYRSAPVV